ncbi:beta-amylase [Sarracenia purpurea var. burkii]
MISCMLASLKACAREFGMQEWGNGSPIGGGNLVRDPEYSEFFKATGSWNSPDDGVLNEISGEITLSCQAAITALKGRGMGRFNFRRRIIRPMLSITATSSSHNGKTDCGCFAGFFQESLCCYAKRRKPSPFSPGTADWVGCDLLFGGLVRGFGCVCWVFELGVSVGCG